MGRSAFVVQLAPKPAKAEPQKPAANNVPVTPPDDSLVPPEIVQLRGMQIIGQVKTLTMSNSTGEYHLSCNLKADGCETPTPGKNYLLINKNTHWKLPGAEKYIDLAFIQSWTVTYTKTENVGLVPQDHAHAGFWLGLYMLDSVNTPKTQ